MRGEVRGVRRKVGEGGGGRGRRGERGGSAHVPQVRVARCDGHSLRRLTDGLAGQPVGDAVVVALHLEPVAPVGRLG